MEANREKFYDLKAYAKTIAVMTGSLAGGKKKVLYLTEGVHAFTLKSGATFKIYVSPYLLESEERAFTYKCHHDRFNMLGKVSKGVKSIAVHPILDFGKDGVDIVMTHGPPKGILDPLPYDNVECENLLHPVRRAKPLLHCFGHIHAGYGAKIVTWKEGDGELIPKNSMSNVYPKSNK